MTIKSSTEKDQNEYTNMTVELIKMIKSIKSDTINQGLK